MLILSCAAGAVDISWVVVLVKLMARVLDATRGGGYRLARDLPWELRSERRHQQRARTLAHRERFEALRTRRAVQLGHDRRCASGIARLRGLFASRGVAVRGLHIEFTASSTCF